MLAGQSDALFEPAKLLITTPTPSIEIPAQEFFFAKVQGTSGKALTTRSGDKDLYWCRIPENSWSLTVLHDKGTLMSSHNSQNQWHVVSTLCHEMKIQLTRKVGFEGTPKLDPCWKSQQVTCKVNMEWKIRIESVNKDVSIFHELNKLVTDLIDKEDDDNGQKTLETKTEAFALKTDVLGFASRSKAKAKSRTPTSACSSTRTVPIRERIRTDIEPGTQSNQAYPVA